MATELADQQLGSACPSGGVSDLPTLGTMLIGHNVEISVLLDGDDAGRKAGEKFVKRFLPEESGRCFFIGDFLPDTPYATLEDLVPEDDYLSAVKEACSLKDDIKFDEDEKKLPGVVVRFKAYFEQNNLGKFEKGKPVANLRDRIHESGDWFPNETRDVITRIMAAVNGALSNPDVS